MASKPKKPHRTFPLTPHVRGGWAKHYKGHSLYIAQRDPKLALAEFHRIAKRIDEEGAPPHKKPSSNITVYDVCNRYVYERTLDVKAKKLGERSLETYTDAAKEMIATFGADTFADDLTPDHFTRLFRRWDKKWGSHTMARMIQASRTIWNHAEANDWIGRRPRFGSVFRKPMLEKKAGEGFTIEQARALVACCVSNVQLEAMVLLMLNGGYLASDCAKLPRAAVNFKTGLITFPRPKMSRRRPIDRVMVMWPETAEALAEVFKQREGDSLVFRTSHGNPWVQGRSVDSVRRLVQRIIDYLGWPMRGPAWLRHLHRTLADELEKPSAAARLMGHRLPGMAQVYVDFIEGARIREITNHIRLRLWPNAPKHAGP